MNVKQRILFMDIETTDLNADFGNMLAFGYKWHDEKKAHVISLLDTNKACDSCNHINAVSDAPLVKAVWPILASAGAWVTWYGKGFDSKFLNTRILDAGMKPLPPIPHIDLYYAAKTHLKLSSNRLANVQNFLRLPTEKTVLDKRTWRQAQAGHPASLEYIIDHCRKDVLVLEEAYERLKAYVRMHPSVLGSRGSCRVCGGTNLQRRGMAVSRGVRRARFQCQTCGRWDAREIKS